MTSTTASSSSDNDVHTCPYAKGILSSTTNTNFSDNETQTPPPSSPISTSASHSPTTPAEALSLAKKSCPAFKNSCPFRDAKNSEDVRKTMMNIPSTHHVEDGGDEKEGGGSEGIGKTFRMALEHMHKVSMALQEDGTKRNDGGNENIEPRSPSPLTAISTSKEEEEAQRNRYVLEGGCPFKTYYQKSGSKKEGEPFVNVMENLSLSAIMSRMVSDLEEDEKKKKEEPEAVIDEKEETTTKLVKDDEEQTESTTAVTEQQQTTTKKSSSSTIRRASLSKALKTGTTTSHASAESVHFVRNFIRGKINKELYKHLVSSLYHIYYTLEEELSLHGPTYFPSLYFPQELNRVESLEDDLDFYHGEDYWKKEAIKVLERSVATRDYCHRIKYIAKTDPLLLLSHAYTRYLGDLSGGRILARVARKALHLSADGDGLRFYMFDNVSNPKQFKDEYRRALDELNLEEDVVERLVGEANVAFALNVRVFEELDVMDGVLEVEEVMSLEEATGYLDRVLEEQKKRRESDVDDDTGAENEIKEGYDDAAKCPFAYLGGPNPHRKSEEKKNGVDMTGTESKKNASFISDKSSANTTTASTTVAETNIKEGKCPWPFILLHDFKTGMGDYRSKIVLGLIICWLWSCFVKSDLHREFVLHVLGMDQTEGW